MSKVRLTTFGRRLDHRPTAVDAAAVDEDGSANHYVGVIQ